MSKFETHTKNSTQAKPFCLYTKPRTWHGQSTRCDLNAFQGHLCLCDLHHRLKPNFKANPLSKTTALHQAPKPWIVEIPIDLSPKCPQVLTTWQGIKSLAFPGLFRFPEAECCHSCFKECEVDSKSGFLNISTIDILDWMVFCSRGRPVYCRVFSDLSTLVLVTKTVSRHCLSSTGSKITLDGEPLLSGYKWAWTRHLGMNKAGPQGPQGSGNGQASGRTGTMWWKSVLMTSVEETPVLAPALPLESVHPGIFLVVSHSLGGCFAGCPSTSLIMVFQAHSLFPCFSSWLAIAHSFFQFSFIIGRILWAYFFPFEISCTQLLKGPEPDLAIPMTDPIKQDGAVLHDMGSLRDVPCYGITGLAGWARGECPVKLIMGIWSKEKVTEGGVLWGAVCSTDTR